MENTHTLRIDHSHLDAALDSGHITEEVWESLRDLDGTAATEQQQRLFGIAVGRYGADVAMIEVNADGWAYAAVDRTTDTVARCWVEIVTHTQGTKAMTTPDPACQNCGDTGRPDLGDHVQPVRVADGTYRWACAVCAASMHPLSATAWPIPDDSAMTEQERGYWAALSGIRPR